jgi:hypothetical protein
VAKARFSCHQNQEAIPSDQRSRRILRWKSRRSQSQKIGMIVVIIIEFL